MAASSMAARTPFLLSLARQLLPPPASRHLCSSLQLLRHYASSSPSCEHAQRLRAPSTGAAAGTSCATNEEGEPAKGGGDDEADSGAPNKGVGPAAAPTLRAAPAGRRRRTSPPKGRPGPPRQSGGAKVHAADKALAKRKGKGRRGNHSPPGPPRQGPGGGGGAIHSVSSSSTPSSSSSS